MKNMKRTQIYEWIKQIPELEDVYKTARGRNMKRTRRIGSATNLPSDDERVIVLWINSLRADGVPVSSVMQKIKAKDVGNEINIAPEHFQASWTWQKLFLQRHRLAFQRRTRCGQIQPQLTTEVVQETNKRINQLMAEHRVDIVFNADQTAVCFEYIPKMTIAERGQKTVWVYSAGNEKERVTAMLLGDSHGQKYTPFVVVKMAPSKIPATHDDNVALRHGFGIKTWKDMEAARSANSLQIHANVRGWRIAKLSCRFLRYHFGCRASMSTPVLLLWDDFSGHWTDDVRACASELNVVLIPVSPGYTSVCQPADISWNFPVKTLLRKRWLAFVSGQVLDHDRASSFELQAPTRVDIMEWIGYAWAGLTSSTISNEFRSVVVQN
jgi:hypothetical protein